MDNKYFWYSIDYGISDDFDSYDSCVSDAIKNNTSNPSEYYIYSYDSHILDSNELDIDDTTYLGYVH